MYLNNILNSMKCGNGKYIVSIIIALGIASLFRKVCTGRDCIVLHGPPLDKIKDKIYGYNNKCYNFKEKAIACGTAPKQVLY